MSTFEVTKDEIRAAYRRATPYIRRTPLLDLGDVFGHGYGLSLKLDTMQPSGSFKDRGAFSALAEADVPAVGVAAASGGNFGLAVAHACQVLGFPSTIFVPDSSPEDKIGRIEGYGAEVRRVAGHYHEALLACQAWSSDNHAVQVHAYDQREVMAGQGTCALEVSRQTSFDTILVAVGGGGLIGGIASWIRDDARVVGVEPELCPTLFEARRHGGPIDVEVGGVAVSSLGASRLGDHPWFANKWIDDSLLVSDRWILAAQEWLWATCRVVSEPSAAVPVAVLLSGVYRPQPGEQLVAVISGANTDPGSVV